MYMHYRTRVQTVYGESEFYPEVNVYSSFSRNAFARYRVEARVSLELNSYEAGSGDN